MSISLALLLLVEQEKKKKKQFCTFTKWEQSAPLLPQSTQALYKSEQLPHDYARGTMK